MKELRIEKKKILILAPHPDDECIGCGGVISMYPDQCTVVVMTDGRLGGTGKDTDYIKEIRRQEFESEMKYAGINRWRLLEYKDNELLENYDCMNDIRFEDFDVVFIPSKSDNHPDHVATSYYAHKAISNVNPLAEVYEYEVHQPLQDTDFYLDITDFIERKEKLIGFHKSQTEMFCFIEKVKAAANYRACCDNKPGKKYEVFKRVYIENINCESDKLLTYEKKLGKYKLMIEVLSKWVEADICGKKNISEYFERMKINSISVYGFSIIGRLLYQYLLRENVKIEEILDNRELYNDLGEHIIVKPNGGNNNVDAIIVTALFEYEDVKKTLVKYGYRNIISISSFFDF